MFHEGNRLLQDRYGGRKVADRLVERRTRSEFAPEHVAFIQSVPFFFIATGHEDILDCSFKGGDPGFVRVTDKNRLAYPDYDGNRMFKTLGNLVKNPNVGLLFIRFDREQAGDATLHRLRVTGLAEVHDDHPLLSSCPGAMRIVEVTARYIFPNCPRYIPEMRMVEPSRYVPREGEEPPVPQWKQRDYIKEVIDPASKA